MRTLNSEHIITTLDEIAKQHFRDDDINSRAARLAYQVGLSNSKIRELCVLLNDAMQVLEVTSVELEKLQIERNENV